MQISIYNHQKDLSLSTSKVKKILVSLLKHLNIETDEVTVHFVSRRKICQLHEQFFDDPSSTDCISLPIDPPGANSNAYHVLGEIFVCPKTAIEYAEKKGLDPYTETTLYMIHGLLHLIGYDDMTPLEKKKMRRKEKECLAVVSSFSLRPSKKGCLKIGKNALISKNKNI